MTGSDHEGVIWRMYPEVEFSKVPARSSDLQSSHEWLRHDSVQSKSSSWSDDSYGAEREQKKFITSQHDHPWRAQLFLLSVVAWLKIHRGSVGRSTNRRSVRLS